MPRGHQKINEEIQTSIEPKRIPRGLQVSERGLYTSLDVAEFMSGVASDVYAGLVSPGVANAAVNATGKLLKVVELQMKYGTQGKGPCKILQLVPKTSEEEMDTKIQ